MSESKKCIDCGGVFPPMEPICTHCWDRYQSMSMRKSRHIAQLEAENERLQKIKSAAKAIDAEWFIDYEECPKEVRALHEALGGE